MTGDAGPDANRAHATTHGDRPVLHGGRAALEHKPVAGAVERDQLANVLAGATGEIVVVGRDDDLIGRMTAEPPEDEPFDRGPRLTDARRCIDHQPVEVATLERRELGADERQVRSDLISRVEMMRERDRRDQLWALIARRVRIDGIGDGCEHASHDTTSPSMAPRSMTRSKARGEVQLHDQSLIARRSSRMSMARIFTSGKN